MTVLATTRSQAYSTGYTGRVYVRTLNRTTGASVYKNVPIPSGIAVLPVRPCFAYYKGRTYISGMFSRMLVYAEDGHLYPAGLTAPNSAPTLTAASASALIDGETIGYLTYAQKIGEEIVSESNPSAGSATLNVRNKAITWTLPTSGHEPHTTHIRGWRTIAGSFEHLVFDTTLGGSSITESVPTVVLDENDALPNDGENAVLDNGIPPYTRYCMLYHDRMFFAGDPKYPSRLWWSELRKPWAVGDTPDSYFDMRDGEQITGLGVQDDRLIVFCNGAIYQVTGYGDGSDGFPPDLSVDKLFTGIGCISHHSIVDVNGRLWFAAEDGIRVYDGGMHYMMEGMRTYWRADFEANPVVYRDSVAVNNIRHHAYELLIPKTSGGFYYVANYLATDPAVGGSGLQPYWSFKRRNRYDTCIGMLRDADGLIQSFTGASDGNIRQEDVSTDPYDDGDTYNKYFEILSKHYTFGDPGGDDDEGKTLPRLWVYAEHEAAGQSYKVWAIGGDDAADTQASPQWWAQEVTPQTNPYTIGATSYTPIPVGTQAFTPEVPAGRGFTFKISGSRLTGFKFRGWGALVGPGVGRTGHS